MLLTIDERGSKISRNSVFGCHLSPLLKTLFLMIFDLHSLIVLTFDLSYKKRTWGCFNVSLNLRLYQGPWPIIVHMPINMFQTSVGQVIFMAAKCDRIIKIKHVLWKVLFMFYNTVIGFISGIRISRLAKIKGLLMHTYIRGNNLRHSVGVVNT